MKSKLEPLRLRLGSIWAKLTPPPPAGKHSVLFLLLLGVAFNLISIAAPGYFGPDEQAIQFLVIEGRSFGEMLRGWFDSIFRGFSKGGHYRPFTSVVWWVLSFFFYAAPVLFILSNALLSVLNGVLIYHLVLRVSGQVRAALWAFLAFNVFPATAFDAGWVATICDKLFLGFSMVALHILVSDRNASLQRPGATWSLASLRSLGGWKLTRSEAWRQVGIALCLVLGILSKEPMLTFPAFVGGLCMLVKPWRGWVWALLISSAIVAGYLTLRLPEIVQGDLSNHPRSLNYIFPHMLSYWIYPFVWDNWMLHDVIHAPAAQRWLAGILSSLPVLLLLLRSKWRWALAYLCYYYVFVSPVLIGEGRFANYLYGAGLPVAVMFAYVFRSSGMERRWLRAVACGLFAMLALHSAYVQWSFYEHGAAQQRAYASLAAIVRGHDQRTGNAAAKFAIVADRGITWNVLYRSFFPPKYRPARNIAGLNLQRRVTVHHSWPGDWGPHAIPADAVRLRITPDGHIAEE